MELGRYSIGIGDRFAHQGRAQLAALIRAAEQGAAVTPVWNKSHREHMIIGSSPASVRAEADAAVREMGWPGPYFVDADHIHLGNVDAFIASSDFFTLDVAEAIGQAAEPEHIETFAAAMNSFTGTLYIEGLAEPLTVTEDNIRVIARRFLAAVQQAGRIYRHIAERKGSDDFITEVSMDETDAPQSPGELLFILAALAREGVPARTIAPKFTGRFNKGVDYDGDVKRFSREFNDDLAVIRFAVAQFNLPADLKLSVHSGSDKFSLYGPIRRALTRHQAGVHLKTAGTTWLEELIGLALAGGDGVQIAREIYRRALDRYEELCAPYATVIDIDTDRLPPAEAVDRWDGPTFAAALRHDPACPSFNPHLRQLLHLSYKIAAEMGPQFLAALDKHADAIAPHVTENLYDRHIRPLFLDV